MAEVDASGSLLVHIGYHKTGTTWLQRYLFANQDAGFLTVCSVVQAARLFAGAQPAGFDAGAVRQEVREGFETAARRQLTPAISSERLSGNPHSGGYDAAEICSRLAETWPDARILIIVRNQLDAIVSVYKQYVKIGGRGSLERYLQPPNDLRIPLFAREHFEYHHLIARYRKAFGAERVLVVPYENFRAHPARFVEGILSFAGRSERPDLPYDISVNESISALGGAIARRLNVFAQRTTINPYPTRFAPGRSVASRAARIDRLVPATVTRRVERRWRRVVATLLQDHYAASNRATAELTGLDLAELGYPIAR